MLRPCKYRIRPALRRTAQGAQRHRQRPAPKARPGGPGGTDRDAVARGPESPGEGAARVDLQRAGRPWRRKLRPVDTVHSFSHAQSVGGRPAYRFPRDRRSWRAEPSLRESPVGFCGHSCTRKSGRPVGGRPACRYPSFRPGRARRAPQCCLFPVAYAAGRRRPVPRRWRPGRCRGAKRSVPVRQRQEVQEMLRAHVEKRSPE